MEPILDYLDVNTFDIWTFEANQFLIEKRTDEQIIKVKSALEHQIIMSRREQINKNLTVTINPIVTINDYDNGTDKDYWVRHEREIGETKTIHDRVNLGYFNVYDAGIDSFFSLEQYIVIDKENDQYDFWFALKLSQYKSGIKHIPDFLNYQMQEVFHLDADAFCEFLEEVILQYKDEFIDEKVCQKTEKWIESQKPEIAEQHVSLITKEIVKSEPKEKRFTVGYRTFLLRKAESNVGYFNSRRNESALHELWNDLVHAGLIEKQTIEKFKSIFLNVPIKKENRIVWSKSIKSLIEFVRALINSKRIVELGGVDHWLVTIECFVLKNSKEIKFKSLSQPESKDSPFKEEIELMVQKFCAKLE
jgi:hypothetical protein